MSSRPQLNPQPVIVNGNMSTTLTSVVTIIQKISAISYSYEWSGTSPSGIVTVQVSNDYSQNADGTVRNPGTWDTMPLSAPTNVSGNTGNGFIDMDGCAAYAMRTVYTPISGTGVLNVVIAGKVF